MAVWAKAERPIAERAPLNVLFGIKWQLTQWGTVPKEALWVDESSLTLQCDGEEVPLARTNITEEGHLEVKFSADWENWAEFRQSPEIESILSRAMDKLKSGKGKSKSKGKTMVKGKGPNQE